MHHLRKFIQKTLLEAKVSPEDDGKVVAVFPGVAGMYVKGMYNTHNGTAYEFLYPGYEDEDGTVRKREGILFTPEMELRYSEGPDKGWTEIKVPHLKLDNGEPDLLNVARYLYLIKQKPKELSENTAQQKYPGGLVTHVPPNIPLGLISILKKSGESIWYFILGFGNHKYTAGRLVYKATNDSNGNGTKITLYAAKIPGEWPAGSEEITTFDTEPFNPSKETIEKAAKLVWDNLHTAQAPGIKHMVAFVAMHKSGWAEWEIYDDMSTIWPLGVISHSGNLYAFNDKVEFEYAKEIDGYANHLGTDFKDNPVKAIRFLYLKTQKPIQEHISESAYKPQILGWSDRIINSGVKDHYAIKRTYTKRRSSSYKPRETYETSEYLIYGPNNKMIAKIEGGYLHYEENGKKVTTTEFPKSVKKAILYAFLKSQAPLSSTEDFSPQG